MAWFYGTFVVLRYFPLPSPGTRSQRLNRRTRAPMSQEVSPENTSAEGQYQYCSSCKSNRLTTAFPSDRKTCSKCAERRELKGRELKRRVPQSISKPGHIYCSSRNWCPSSDFGCNADGSRKKTCRAHLLPRADHAGGKGPSISLALTSRH